jgi:hypothetical protein
MTRSLREEPSEYHVSHLDKARPVVGFHAQPEVLQDPKAPVPPRAPRDPHRRPVVRSSVPVGSGSP